MKPELACTIDGCGARATVAFLRPDAHAPRARKVYARCANHEHVVPAREGLVRFVFDPLCACGHGSSMHRPEMGVQAFCDDAACSCGMFVEAK